MAAKPDENKASLVSLADAYPNLAAEWHPTLNGELTVDQVSPGSSRKVWWRCAAGHEWQANVKNSRRNERSSCPVCLGRRVVPGFNDLATVRPDLAAQWHPTQNGALTPAMVPRSTDRKVWWQCQKGHEWQATVNNRESKNQGCPFCGGSKAIPGVSDLATVEPAIAAQWHPTRNGELSPSMVLGGSSRVVWWLCDVAPDHEWRTAIANRTNSSNRTGCPMCVGHKVVASNCLAAKFPDVAAEWHPSRNGSLSPHLVTTRVTRKVWWQCSKGHEWRTAISSRTRPKPTGCPYCSRKKAIPGETDFATLHPEIAAELHPTRNGAITPNMLRPGSNKKVWWRCVKGHEWQVYVAQRTIHSSGCPYCAGQRPIVGVNDLATTHPDIAAQWNRTRNKHLTPESVMAGTDRKVWWICDDGHEWAAPPYSRTNGIGCPSCAKTGFNPCSRSESRTVPRPVSRPIDGVAGLFWIFADRCRAILRNPWNGPLSQH